MRASAALLALCAVAVPALVAAAPMDLRFPSQGYAAYPDSSAQFALDSASPDPDPADLRSLVHFVMWSLDMHIKVTQQVVNFGCNQILDSTADSAAARERLNMFYVAVNQVVPADPSRPYPIDNEIELNERLRDLFKQTEDSVGPSLQSSIGQTAAELQSALQALELTDRTPADPLPLLKQLWVPVLRNLNNAILLLPVPSAVPFVSHGQMLSQLIDDGEKYEDAFAGDMLQQYLSLLEPENVSQSMDGFDVWQLSPDFQDLVSLVYGIINDRQNMKMTFGPTH